MSSLPCRHLHRRATLCAAILSGFALHTQAAETPAPVAKPQAVSANTVATFSVKAGSTLEVLRAIEQQSGVTIRVEPSVAARQTSPAITGAMSPRQAILRAIDGTGLTLGEQANGTFTVAPVQTLGVVNVFAQRDKAETRFKADRSDTASRSGADLSEIPQSVTILTSKVLETQQTRTLMDSLKNVSGLSFSQSPQGAAEFNIRAMNATVTSNGVSDPYAAQNDAFAVERVEVLKGPQAILSGSGSMGGGVNIVTKKPQTEERQTYLAQYGSHGDTTLGADFTGMLGSDKRLSYRVIGSVAKSSSAPGGYDGRDDYSFTPQVRWKDPSTDLILGAAVSQSHQAMPEYTFAYKGRILPIPEMKLAGDSDGFSATSKKVFYQLEHKVNADITLVSRMQYTEDRQELHLYQPIGGVDSMGDPDILFGPFFGLRSINREKNLSGDHYVRMKFETGEIGHKLSVGMNHTKRKITQDQTTGEFIMAQVYPAVPMPFPPARESSITPSYLSDNPTSQVGLYAQDLMNWGNWNLLLNVRRTKYSNGPATGQPFGSPTVVIPELKVNETTPGAGIIYNINDHASVYGSYQEGFQPQASLSCQNTTLPPVRSKSKELGAKFDLLDSKLSITTALFNTITSNSPSYNRLLDCYTSRDGTETRGVELDVQGELAPGLNVILNFTHSKASDPGNAARLFAGLPHNKLSLWGTYALTGLGYDGWGVGLGVTTSSRSEGSEDLTKRFEIPAQAQWDASVFYEKAGWSTTVGLKNIFDKRLYDVSTSPNYVPIKEGRTFMVTVKKTFN